MEFFFEFFDRLIRMRFREDCNVVFSVLCKRVDIITSIRVRSF